MFSPRNYTFHRGEKSFLRGENFIPRNYTFLRGIILSTAEKSHVNESLDMDARNLGCGCSASTVETDCIHMKSIEEVRSDT